MNTFREAVQDYLDLRRGLGFKLQEAAKALTDFVAFLEQHRADYITQALALAWAQRPSRARPAYWASRLCIVRGFARYRSAADPRTQIPPYGLLPFHPKRARPFFYSDGQIHALLCAAFRMECPHERGKLRSWVYYCLFGLLTVTGLRLGEARNLQLQDVDLKAAILTIRGTKFGKERLVPLHRSTCAVLAKYIVERQPTGKDEQYPLIFSSPTGATVWMPVTFIAPSTGHREKSACAVPRTGMDLAFMTFVIALR